MEDREKEKVHHFHCQYSLCQIHPLLEKMAMSFLLHASVQLQKTI